MCSIQFECCPSTTVTLGPIKNSLIILSLYLSTVFQLFRAGEKGYYVTPNETFGMIMFDIHGKPWSRGMAGYLLFTTNTKTKCL